MFFMYEGWNIDKIICRYYCEDSTCPLYHQSRIISKAVRKKLEEREEVIKLHEIREKLKVKEQEEKKEKIRKEIGIKKKRRKRGKRVRRTPV